MKLLDNFRERHSDGRAAAWWAQVRPYLPPINFITVHYAYFILSCLFFALIFWGSGTSSSLEIGFLDSVYLSMSALTSTGMNTSNLSQMSTGQQVVLFLAMMVGSPILISLWIVLFRRHMFERRFRAIVKAERERKLRSGSSTGLAVGLAELRALARVRLLGKKARDDIGNVQLPEMGGGIVSPANGTTGVGVNPRVPEREERDVEAGLASVPEHAQPGLLSPGGRSMRSSVAFREPPRLKRAAGDGDPVVRSFLEDKKDNIGRNGEFFNLTLTEREYLGGVEYRAVELLVVTVGLYYVLWQLLGAIALGSWIAVNAPEIPAANQQNPWWSGVFLSISAFTNGGMTLLDAGMIVFQNGYYFVLIVVTLLTLAGSQASPIFLRGIFYVLSRLLRFSTKDESYAVWKETFDFILQYPRRVYINMFPAKPTWMLALWLSGFLVVDWIMFFLLNIGNEAIESIPPGPRVMDGLFQSVSILSGGFSVVPLSSVYFGLQVLWLVKMYASAYPTSITVRGSNVYEERSLGIYAGDEPEEDHAKGNEKMTPVGAGGLLLSPGVLPGGPRVPLTPMSATSQASRFSQASRRGMDRIVGLGREGGAMFGRQIQRRMTGFQGVGVAPMRPVPVAGANGVRFSVPQLNRGPRQQDDSESSNTDVHSLSAQPEQAAPDLMYQHVRSQLSHDVWWIALAFFIITIIETSHTLADPAAFSLFNILFEIVSAYANNGVSIGLPHVGFSFSGGWHGGSKFVLVLVMLRGRHRDLPVALDRAVKLPSLGLDEKEEDDAGIRRTLSRTPNLSMSRSVSRF